MKLAASAYIVSLIAAVVFCVHHEHYWTALFFALALNNSPEVIKFIRDL